MAKSEAPGRPGQCKGSLLVHLQAYIVRDVGKTEWDAAAAQLSPPDRAVLGGLLLAGGWYPVGVWNRSLKTYLDKFATSERDRQRRMLEMAAYIAREDLSTVFKVLLRIATPAMVVERTPTLWARYFDTGEMRPRELADHRWEVVLDAPGDEDHTPDELTCKYGVPGWLARALELSGAKAQITKTRCRMRGARECGYEITW